LTPTLREEGVDFTAWGRSEGVTEVNFGGGEGGVDLSASGVTSFGGGRKHGARVQESDGFFKQEGEKVPGGGCQKFFREPLPLA